jgi:hypothetical protein
VNNHLLETKHLSKTESGVFANPPVNKPIDLQSISINELIGAKAKADGELNNIKKSSKNPHRGSWYADLDAITRIVRPVYSKHGLSVSHLMSKIEESDVMITLLAHESGQWIISVMDIKAQPNKQGNITPQEIGSAITYARRYSLASIANVAQTDEDDDGELASNQIAPVKVLPKKIENIEDSLDEIFPTLEESLEKVNSISQLEAFMNANSEELKSLKETDQARRVLLLKQYNSKKESLND